MLLLKSNCLNLNKYSNIHHAEYNKSINISNSTLTGKLLLCSSLWAMHVIFSSSLVLNLIKRRLRINTELWSVSVCYFSLVYSGVWNTAICELHKQVTLLLCYWVHLVPWQPGCLSCNISAALWASAPGQTLLFPPLSAGTQTKTHSIAATTMHL